MSALLAAGLISAGMIVTQLVAAGAAAADTTSGPGPIMQPTAQMPSTDPLPTAQIDGVAWKQAIVGNTVYVGGSFSTARPAGAAAGSNTVSRPNLLSYDIRSGVLTPGFAPVLNGQVLNLTASPDGTRLYVVGDFTTVNGETHNHIAAFDTSTGTLISSFTAGVNGTAKAVLATNSNVYVGGGFSGANSVSRTRLAAFDTSGALTGWNPTADYTVNDMVLNSTGSQVDIAGQFTNLNSTPVYGIGAVDAGSGALMPFSANQLVKAYGTSAGFTSLVTDGTSVYGTAYNYHGTGNLEGMFSADASTGKINYVDSCHGDNYGVAPVNGVAYIVGHPHYCEGLGGWPLYSTPTYRISLAFTTAATGTLLHDTAGYGDHYGQPAPSLYNWFPDFTTGTASGANQAAWAVAGNSDYLVEAGEFPTVNGVAQQGLVRFATRANSPHQSGPQVTGAHFVPTLTNVGSGQIRVAFQANWDRDDLTLNYQISRNGDTGHPVWTKSVNSTFWNRPMLGFTDSGLTPGTQYRYRIFVTDSDGNSVGGDSVSITAGGATLYNSYDQQARADGANGYWPLNESSGATALDLSGYNDMDVSSSVTRGTTGPISGVTASTFNGTDSLAATRAPIPGPDTGTVAAWVRTTSTSGGEIVGFGDNPVATSSYDDRMLYLTNDGNVSFGILTDTSRPTISSTTPINDGKWHFVTGTFSPTATELWVDGQRVGKRTDMPTETPAYRGWWRIGGDALGSWTTNASSNFLTGDVGLAAVYPTVLSRSAIAAYAQMGGVSVPSVSAPTDPVGAAVYSDNPDLYWRLDDTSAIAADASANGVSGTYSQSGVTRGANSTVTANGTGAAFDGTSGTIASNTSFTDPTIYSAEAWFQTSSTTGGKIIGFGSSNSGNSTQTDRSVYLLNDGRLVFGSGSGSQITLTTTGRYNDNAWHQVVATQGPSGMTLYVDGLSVASNTTSGSGNYTGYWRAGGDTSWSGTNGYLSGRIDEVSVYSYVLPAARVLAHYKASPAAVNRVPTAAFTATYSSSGVTFDATASQDTDGSIAGYAWNFGDGTTGSSATLSHQYAQADGRSYPVTLTVTDDSGGTGTTTRRVVPLAANAIVTDDFSRAIKNGFGVANLGGAWTVVGDPGKFAVTPQVATIQLRKALDGAEAYIGSATGSADVRTDLSLSDVPAGGPAYITVTPRRVSAGNSYLAKLVVNANGTVTVRLSKVLGGSETVLAGAVSVPGITYVAGQSLAVRAEAFGSSPTTIRVKVWRSDQAEPSAWQLSTTDTTASLQTTGQPAISALSGQGVTSALTLTMANFQAFSVGVPSVSFTKSATNLAAAFDASGSSDSDGRIVSYAWSFGDGTTGTGVSPSHTYSAAGTYTVGLTVTDDSSLTATTTASVTVRNPNVAPTAAFTSTSSGFTASLDASGSTDSDGSVTGYSWDFGDGTTGTAGPTTSHIYSAAGSYTVTLVVTDDSGATSSALTSSVPVDGTVASDAFARTISGGLGTADQGGPWTNVAGSSSLYSDDGDKAVLSMPNPGNGPSVALNSVSAGDVDIQVDATMNRAVTGNGAFAMAGARRVGTSEYRVKLKFPAAGTGGAMLYLSRTVSGTETTLASKLLSTLMPGAGTAVRIEFRVTGSAPATLAARAWPVGSSVPDWQLTTTDTTPSLAGPGGLSLLAYLGTSSTTSMTTSFDNLLAKLVQ